MTYIFSFIITAALVPIFAKIAFKFGIVDRPDGVLKTHSRVTPYLGGLGMFLGISPILWRDSYSLMLVSVLVSVGLLDDLLSLSPKLRLLFEFTVASGIVMRFLGFHDLLYSILFVIGIVALVNAVNMIDGMDGLAGGSVAISAIYLFLASENSFSKSLSLGLIAICVAFLIYNFPPAKVFMGDAGSYLLGSLLSIILASSMRYGFDARSLKFIFPVWIYLLDLSMSVVRRVRSGKSPFGGDRDHFYDKIYKKFGGKVKTVLISYLIVGVSSSFILVKPFTLALILELVFSIFIIHYLKLLTYES